MTLTQFIDCFWVDRAPYLMPALLIDPSDEIVNYTYWTKADEFDRIMFGEEVIATRKLEKKHVRTSRNRLYTPTNTVQHIALME